MECTALLLQISALLSVDWVTIQAEGEVMVFSLYRCETCAQHYANYTPECIINIDCQLTTTPFALCALAKCLSWARDHYLTPALLALLMTVILSTDELYKSLGYAPLPKWVFCLVGVVRFTALCTSLTMWLEAVSSELGKSMKVGVGPVYVTSALVVISLSSLFRAFSRSKLPFISNKIPEKSLGSIRLFPVFLPFFFLSVSFNSLSYHYPWIHYPSHQGYLFTIDQYLSFTSIHYSCISGPACLYHSTSFDIRRCGLFNRIYEAGVEFIWLDGVGFAVEIVWLVSGICYVLRYRYGPDVCRYIWPVATVGVKGMAVWRWMVVSEASIFSTGSQIRGNWYSYREIQADIGAKYAVLHVIFLTLAGILCLFIYTVPSVPRSILPAGKDTYRGHLPLCVICSKPKRTDETYLKFKYDGWLHIRCFSALPSTPYLYSHPLH